MLADARAINNADVNLMYAEAVIHVLAGRSAEALTALGTALKAGYPLANARIDPDLKSLRADPGLPRW
jgi:hypothetical protein